MHLDKEPSEMEVAMTEALASGMKVLQEDNALLEGIAKAYDNNPNYRYEVGRVVGIREVATLRGFQIDRDRTSKLSI